MDDLGWRDLGCYGSQFYETPVLDQLAAESVVFSDAYASAPVCSPTRASLLTGRYPARVGITQWIGGHAVGRLCDVPYFQFLPAQEVTLARLLREVGYTTWHVGKWHLGDRATWPDRHGFDVNVGGCDWGRPKNGYFSPYGCPTLADGPQGEYLTDRLTDEAIALIRGRDNRPFFLNFWPYAVHTPIEAPRALVDKYSAKAHRLGLDADEPFVEEEPFPCWHKRHLRVRRRTFQSDPAYAAMVENLDWNVGRLLREVDGLGLTTSTIVVFTSDNGGLATAEGSPTSNAPLAEGKGWMYEGGVRVPLMFRWPGVVTPRDTALPVTTPDLFPTLVELAGARLSGATLDGVSLAPALSGTDLKREPLFWHYPHYSNQGGKPAAAVRSTDWKLIYFYDTERVELYNLASDIGETTDLAPTRPDVVGNLKGLLGRWSASVGCLTPKRNSIAPFSDAPGAEED